MEEQPKKLLQWHAAFYAGIQIELEDEAENLFFENEHMLSTKPMQVDVLIITRCWVMLVFTWRIQRM